MDEILIIPLSNRNAVLVSLVPAKDNSTKLVARLMTISPEAGEVFPAVFMSDIKEKKQLFV